MAQTRQRGSSAGRGHGLGQAYPDTPPAGRRLQAPSLSADPLNRHPSSAGSAPPHSEQAVPTALAARTAGPPRLTPSSIPHQAGIRPTPKPCLWAAGTCWPPPGHETTAFLARLPPGSEGRSWDPRTGQGWAGRHGETAACHGTGTGGHRAARRGAPGGPGAGESGGTLPWSTEGARPCHTLSSGLWALGPETTKFCDSSGPECGQL